MCGFTSIASAAIFSFVTALAPKPAATTAPAPIPSAMTPPVAI